MFYTWAAFVNTGAGGKRVQKKSFVGIKNIFTFIIIHNVLTFCVYKKKYFSLQLSFRHFAFAEKYCFE